MIEFYIINTCDLRDDYKTASGMICMEKENIEGDFDYSFRFCNGYLKKHITKNFAALAFKNADFNIYFIHTNNRVSIRGLIDDLYVHLYSPEDIDLSLLHHSIRKV